ncbi:MAG: hypothetical protein CEN90_542 [Parcubacteria group bacterium Licking1014_17]|nr:MAG: hypothetical protein CEN90_542 [Parcubacteria group bacterium Licking1014_17]
MVIFILMHFGLARTKKMLIFSCSEIPYFLDPSKQKLAKMPIIRGVVGFLFIVV